MNNMVLQGGVLWILMLGGVLVLVQALSRKGCILGQISWYFVLLFYIELVPDRTMAQSFNLVHLKSDLGVIEWM